MANRMSVATIDSPEFINITNISPLISRCEIKVLYVGQNRNNSFITKEVASEMAQTLPGCPIVGYYIDKKEDFGDHGEQVIIDGEGVKFNTLTKPYGFVDLNSKVWFQKFEDTDEFGNTVVREYLMVEGYLWTEQFEECKRVLDKGNPQSMELDSNTLKGHWSTDVNRGIDFFIISDAIFSKLCILGEDVEPCFEGASVTSPEVSSTFKKNDNFVHTLFEMVKELKELTYSLQTKGGETMQGEEMNKPEENQAVPTQAALETQAPASEAAAEQASSAETENFSKEMGNDNSENTAENQNNVEEYKKNEEEKEEDSKEENTEDKKEDDDEDEKKKNFALEEKFALVETELNELKEKYAALEEENKALAEFKLNVENEKKDELINSFYMLSDEDKKDVIENKSKYSLEDIEAKLSVICVRKKVTFASEEQPKQEEVATTFNLNSINAEVEQLPAWLKEVENRRKAN